MIKICSLLIAFVISISAYSDNGYESLMSKANRLIIEGRIYPFIKEENDMTEQEFNRILNKVKRIYAPIVKKITGKPLVVSKKWKGGFFSSGNKVNAYAKKTIFTGKNKIKMYGGLARYHTMTSDAFAMVACHEIGHHIGGAPYIKIRGSLKLKMSNEGQSDYFATLKCFKRYAIGDDNQAIVDSFKDIPEIVSLKCSEVYSNTEDVNICIRSSMAGRDLAYTLHDLTSKRSKKGKKNTNHLKKPKFKTPNTRVVKTTMASHPDAQCRLDTYFKGALCDANLDDFLSDDFKKGTCHRESSEFTEGFRPLCWFKPSKTSI